jgi:hypothetical protein
MMRDRKPTIG